MHVKLMKKITEFIKLVIKDLKIRMACDAIVLMAVLFSSIFGTVAILGCIGSLCNFRPDLDFLARGSWMFTALMAIGSASYIVWYLAKAAYDYILRLINIWKSL
jgi:hypothetical protein